MCVALDAPSVGMVTLRYRSLYHRLAASWTSVERDLHNPKASVRGGEDSDITLKIKNKHEY
jgi:hypothetical protein